MFDLTNPARLAPATREATAAPAAELPASGPWLVWTLRHIPVDPTDPGFEPFEGGYDALIAWLRDYVRHGLDRCTLIVRWLEPHSNGFVIRDAEGAVLERVTLTAAESDTPPPPLREQHCCSREMSVISRSGAPWLLCHECGHHEPRF